MFSRFLQKRNIEYVVGNSIKEMVELNYDKMDEQCLRGMANEAVSEYNELKGKGASAKAVSQSWSVIIDSVREVTAKNQADAEKNLTVLLEYSETVSSRMSVAIPSASSSGSKLSKDKSLIIAKCKSIYENGGCTKSFMEIMINTRNACKDNNANGQMDGHILQLEFFIKCFTTLLLKPRTTAAVTKEAPDNTYYDSASVVSTASQAPKTSSPPSSHRVLSVEEYNARVVTEESVESDGDDEEDDMYEEDEVPILEMLDFEAALVKAGKFVQLLLKKCAGNVSRLRDILVQLYRDNATTPDTPGEVPYHLNRSAFKRVVEDNVQASIAAGYVNKRRVFELMLDIIAKVTEQEKEEIRNAGSYNAGSSQATTTYHAPQFIDHEDGGERSQRIRASAPSVFIDGAKLSTFGASLKQGANLKKKSVKREEKEIIRNLAVSAGRQLDANGFVICEKFLPPDLVHRIRVECGLFQEAYEASEIWVGKEADVGAHLTVPR